VRLSAGYRDLEKRNNTQRFSYPRILHSFDSTDLAGQPCVGSYRLEVVVHPDVVLMGVGEPLLAGAKTYDGDPHPRVEPAVGGEGPSLQRRVAAKDLGDRPPRLAHDGMLLRIGVEAGETPRTPRAT